MLTDRFAVGVSGTRHGLTSNQRMAAYQILRAWKDRHGGSVRLHHGCCVGADEEIHKEAISLGFAVVGHPPVNTTFSALRRLQGFEHINLPRPYLVRNRNIVMAVNKILLLPRGNIFAPNSGGGTWSTLRCAMKMDRVWVMVLGDGTVISGIGTKVLDTTSVGNSVPQVGNVQ